MSTAASTTATLTHTWVSPSHLVTSIECAHGSFGPTETRVSTTDRTTVEASARGAVERNWRRMFGCHCAVQAEVVP